MAGFGDRRDDDFDWFKEIMPTLYELCGECYATIRDRKVVAIHETLSEGADAALERYGAGDYLVQKVGPDESAYTIPWFGVMPA